MEAVVYKENKWNKFGEWLDPWYIWIRGTVKYVIRVLPYIIYYKNHDFILFERTVNSEAIDIILELSEEIIDGKT
jgi:hypothetical protein